MQLKYVGPKPIISYRGVEFDTNKEDKFIYLNIVVQLIKALSHNYFEDKKYIYKSEEQRLSNDELLRELKNICPDLDRLIDRTDHNIENEIAHNIERANENEVLTDEDKNVLKLNIELMNDYLIQRSINKSVYYCAINSLAQLLKKDHIDYIVTPMFQNFHHVLHSVQGVLEEQKHPIDTKLDIYQKDGVMLIKLQVINIG